MYNYRIYELRQFVKALKESDNAKTGAVKALKHYIRDYIRDAVHE